MSPSDVDVHKNLIGFDAITVHGTRIGKRKRAPTALERLIKPSYCDLLPISDDRVKKADNFHAVKA